MSHYAVKSEVTTSTVAAKLCCNGACLKKKGVSFYILNMNIYVKTGTSTSSSSSNNMQDQCLIITDIYGVREKKGCG